MVGLLRFLIVAALLGLVAKLIAKAKQSAEPTASPDWPTWSERHGDAGPTRAKPAETEPSAAGGGTDAGTQPSDEPTEPTDVGSAWVEAVDGECPVGYAVKVKESSGIYHVSGMRNYERTQPDRCYPTTEAAEADGFRASKV